MLKDFGDIAKRLSNNPLGIIALFIVLVYGIAALVLGVSGQTLTPPERLPLVWFLVLFPIVVLVTFAWLVARHHAKLYAPGDFPDPTVFLRTLDPEAQRRKLDQEVEEIELQVAAPTQPKTVAIPSRTELHTKLLLMEDLVMREIGGEFGVAIQRQVGIADIGLDGMFVKNGEAYAIEVKYFRQPRNVSNSIESLRRVGTAAHRLGWKRFNLIFAAVIDDTNGENVNKIRQLITEALDRLDIKPQTRFYLVSELLKKYGALQTGA